MLKTMNQIPSVLRGGLRTILVGLLIFVPINLVAAQSGVTKRNFDRVQIGMNQETVEKILGRPNAYLLACEPGFLGWNEDDGDSTAKVVLGPDGHVVRKEWLEKSTVLERASDLIGLPFDSTYVPYTLGFAFALALVITVLALRAFRAGCLRSQATSEVH